MNEKMQLLFAHIACVALILACFWMSTTVLADQPALGHIVIGLGLFLWGKIGFKPSEAVVNMILEHLSPKQIRKVKSIHPAAFVEAAPAEHPDLTPVHPAPPPLAPGDSMRAAQPRRCARCAADLMPYETSPLCNGCLFGVPK